MMKKILLSAALLTLSACGFTPMHAPMAANGDLAFKNIQVDLVAPEKLTDDEGAFWVQQALYDRLGTSGKAHILSIRPTFIRRGLGISAQDVATRYDMQVSLSYTLTDAKTGDVLDTGNVLATSTFGAPVDPYGRASSEQTATKNVASEAADRLITRLAAYYANAEKTQ